ncbi:murein hydrolase activator EnvC family protein [Geofilum rhodophaeum]|uniref:murein hydrolase activator EnvC family protein n=1 Tax=Geofilum rhodophaeum TaxID=1965019 RepID=UPI000B5214FC|nr:peptidoglycan DD-metalloendopeptidase family protein [Geofilum rhodophaeum]
MTKFIFKYVFFVIIFLGWTHSASAQVVEDLQSEREALLEEIERSRRDLEKTRSSRARSLREMQLLQTEISVRENALLTLQREIDDLDGNIDHLQQEINQIENDLDQLKQEYARLMQDSYLRKNAQDELVYFLSAADFSSSYRRFRLLKEYSDYRRKQGLLLVKSQSKLKGLQRDIGQQKAQKEAALQQIEVNLKSLSASRSDYQQLLRKLQQDESWLRSSISDLEAKAKNLENRILEYIRSSQAGLTGTDFEDFKGKLIWPVSKGLVISAFGEHPHPVLKSVTIKNNGLDIQSISDDKALAVHSGEVSRVVGIPGYNTAILVRHGKYLTVYANLQEVVVKQGQQVQAGQVLGRIFLDDSTNSKVLHFELWQENQKLDPSSWLKP